MKKCIFPVAIMLLSGCAMFHKPSQYMPPASNADIAKVRLAGYTTTYSIDQKNDKGDYEGGTVLHNNGIFNLPHKVARQVGMPQVAGKDYSDDNYYETTLLPGRKTLITHATSECHVSLEFTPKEKGLYEFNYSYSDKSGYCVLYGKEIIYDEINKIYVEHGINHQ